MHKRKRKRTDREGRGERLRTKQFDFAESCVVSRKTVAISLASIRDTLMDVILSNFVTDRSEPILFYFFLFPISL